MRFLWCRAQHCTRARPADSARARSRLAAFAHEAGSSAARARKYILGVWRYGCGDLICSELSLAPARRAPPLIDSAQMNAVARCRLPAPASHSLLPNVRLTAAKHRRHGHQHRHHRRASRRRLHRRRRLFFFDDLTLWREHRSCCRSLPGGWSGKAVTNAAQTARQGGGYRCATWPARRRVWAVVCGALLHARWRTRAATAT